MTGMVGRDKQLAGNNKKYSNIQLSDTTNENASNCDWLTDLLLLVSFSLSHSLYFCFNGYNCTMSLPFLLGLVHGHTTGPQRHNHQKTTNDGQSLKNYIDL